MPIRARGDCRKMALKDLRLAARSMSIRRNRRIGGESSSSGVIARHPSANILDDHVVVGRNECPRRRALIANIEE